MSFTSEIKEELFNTFPTSSHCMIAELSAYVNHLCVFDERQRGGSAVFYSEDLRHIKRIISLLKSVLGIDCEYKELKGPSYIVEIKEPMNVLKLLTVTGVFQGFDSESPINPKVVKKDCCKGAYVRIAFLINGFITDPGKKYHLEFFYTDYSHAYGLKRLLASFGMTAKIIERKNKFVVYLKDSEQISDLLKIIEAYLSLLKLEEIKVYKEVRNNINRRVNCETYNSGKTAEASVREQKAITFIIKSGFFDRLSPKLKETAEVRLENPDLSYAELGKLLEKPVGKSGVYHRLQNIVKIAENLREEK